MRHRVMYGAMGRARKGWSDVWGDGKGTEGMVWCMGRWEGLCSDGQVASGIGRCMGQWNGRMRELLVVKWFKHLKLSS